MHPPYTNTLGNQSIPKIDYLYFQTCLSPFFSPFVKIYFTIKQCNFLIQKNVPKRNVSGFTQHGFPQLRFGE